MGEYTPRHMAPPQPPRDPLGGPQPPRDPLRPPLPAADLEPYGSPEHAGGPQPPRDPLRPPLPADDLEPYGFPPDIPSDVPYDIPELPEAPDAPRGRSGRGRDILEWVVIIAFAVGVATLVRLFVVEPYIIPSESMLETIKVSDKVLGEKLTYRFGEPQQGDIVTFTDPEDPSTTLIKRIIATPGQTVDLVDGQVVVDGEPLDEPYAVGESAPLIMQSPSLDEPVSYPVTLGDDEYWVMGDNRENSLDSRYFGPIGRDAITSKAWVIFWPPGEWRTLS